MLEVPEVARSVGPPLLPFSVKAQSLGDDSEGGTEAGAPPACQGNEKKGEKKKKKILNALSHSKPCKSQSWRFGRDKAPAPIPFCPQAVCSSRRPPSSYDRTRDHALVTQLLETG